MKNIFLGVVVCGVAVTFIIFPNLSHAQETCGSIIEYYDYGDGNGLVIDSETPIEDCANPFGAVTENPNIRISYGTTEISRDIAFPFIGMTEAFVLEGTHPEATSIMLDLYKTVPEGYERINVNSNGKYTFITPGTYTVVVTEDALGVGQNFLQRILASIIPTAYAFPGVSSVVSFTVTEPVEEPQGISNILFLPGIQASRLYTTIDGEEEKLWEPFGDDEVEMLRMTEVGESAHEVYTKDIVDELPTGANIYKGFLQHLIDLDDASGGPLVTTFPYDWRYDIFDVVENGTTMEDGNFVKPTDVIATSAAVSPTGKVTIIAHSNGGLLAKAIMLKLKEEGRENLVDKIIFIATPHIGTPKAIATVLHGYDQQHLSGFVSTDEKVRSVMKNMPGVYGLLPSEAYVNSLTEPMISFDDSETTALYRNAYGFTLTNMDEYTRFLNGDEGREDAGDKINEISTVNTGMLTTALLEHKEKLDTWAAPNGVEVFNIVGTGLPTPKSIEYGEFLDLPCTMYGCTRTKKLEPVVHFTNFGDQTVVSKSSGIQESTNYYVNMKSINGFEHSNITEIETVQTLVNHILHGSSTEGISFVSDIEPTFSENTDIFTIHSPARIYLRDTAGNITGRTEVGGEWKSEISGSSYLEVGSVKYVIVPSDASYDIVIEGEGSGIYTHMLTTLHGETESESIRHTFTASITPSMVVEYKKTGDTFTTATIDANGDEIIEDEMTLDGKIIEKIVTYADLTIAIRALSLPKPYKTALLVLAKQAEQHSLRPERKMSKFIEKNLLLIIQKSIGRYEKRGMITGAERANIDRIINKLSTQ